MRAMTLPEQNQFLLWFPNLNVLAQPRVNAEATPIYNCIAWTLGYTDRWINPKTSLYAWDNFMALNGYIRNDAGGTIAIWKTPAAFTHGSVANAAQGFGWESKCGSSLRILHNNPELNGNSYGNVFTYYERMAVNNAAPDAARLCVTAPRAPLPSLVNEQQKTALLKAAVAEVDPSLQEAFNEQFDAWKKTWFAGAMALSSDTLDRADSFSYRNLLGMGTAIIPLVVEKLANPDNFMATQLYDDLQSTPGLRHDPAPNDPIHLHGEQGRCHAIVSLYLKSRM